ncbi:MAG: hypothetical protein Q6363_010240 [Candidatus Njordarchaeota archaeon]
MAKSIINIIFFGLILPWLFIVIVAPYSAYLALSNLKEYLGPYAQIVSYIIALAIFAGFLLLWYKITIRYVQKMLAVYKEKEKKS